MAALNSLDVRSLLAVAALTSLSIGGTLGFAWMSNRTQRCLAVWATGFLLASLGYFLIWTRGTTPDFVSIILGNCLVLAGGFRIICGLNKFLEVGNIAWQLLVASAIALCLLLFYTYARPSMSHRILVVSSTLGVFAFYAAWRLITTENPGLKGTQTFVAALFMLHGLIMAYRTVDSIFTNAGTDLFTPTVATTVSLLDFLLLFPCIGLAMLSMVHTRSAIELKSEIARRLESETNLLRTTRELEQALAEIKTLKGIIPICGYCKKIRDDSGAWEQLEVYITTHSGAEFSHGICPECMNRHHARL